MSATALTTPGNQAVLLDSLTADPLAIARVAGGLTIHHNLRTFYGIRPEVWNAMRRAQPPSAHQALQLLAESTPHTLTEYRPPDQRVLGACFLESHLLAGMLKYHGHPTRVRAGYFHNIMTKPEVTLAFWREHQLNKARAEGAPFDEERVIRESDTYTQHQIDTDHHIEHWICEVWNEPSQKWVLFDANTDFLQAHSGLDVSVQLPAQYFQFARDAWIAMRSAAEFESDRYSEEPQDGRSHIRSQMLSDYFSLLNHDVTGNAKSQEYAFVKQRRFSDLTPEELSELDALAEALAIAPDVSELVAFFETSSFRQTGFGASDPFSLLSSDKKVDN